MSAAGYRADFLGDGITVPLPEFSPELEGHVLRDEGLHEAIYSRYPNYSVVMNRVRRSPVFVALNINHGQYFENGPSRSWRVDSRVGGEHQLNDDYYEDRPDQDNPFDRGHMAMRAAATWGPDRDAAFRASRETYYFTNAVLQHRWLNRDEWVGLENWARALEDAQGRRVSTITGPIYSTVNQYIEPPGRTPAAVPGAFFKVVLFRHRDEPAELAVRAFIVPQNADTMRGRGGWEPRDLQTYQVSVRMIEELTGLQFPEAVVRANPMFFNESDAGRDLGVTRFPEIREVDAAEHITDPDQPRRRPPASDARVVLLAALINARGRDAENEWITLGNFGAETESLDGWTLEDERGRSCPLDGELQPGETRRVNPLGDIRLANDRAGSITLIDRHDRRVDHVTYLKGEARTEGRPVFFYAPDRFDGAPA